MLPPARDGVKPTFRPLGPSAIRPWMRYSFDTDDVRQVGDLRREVDGLAGVAIAEIAAAK